MLASIGHVTGYPLDKEQEMWWCAHWCEHIIVLDMLNGHMQVINIWTDTTKPFALRLLRKHECGNVSAHIHTEQWVSWMSQHAVSEDHSKAHSSSYPVQGCQDATVSLTNWTLASISANKTYT